MKQIGWRAAVTAGCTLLIATACGTRVTPEAGSQSAAPSPAMLRLDRVEGSNGSSDPTAAERSLPDASSAFPRSADLPARPISPVGRQGYPTPAAAVARNSPAQASPGGATEATSGEQALTPKDRVGGDEAGLWRLEGAAFQPVASFLGDDTSGPTVPHSLVILAGGGTLSGPAGASGLAGGSLASVTQGAQVWVRYINEKGGLNGHQVQLLMYDGGDPGRHRVQIQAAEEQRHVIAFIANAEALSGEASVEYLEGKQVPVIGTDGGEDYAYGSPMYVAQASTGVALYRALAYSLAAMTVAKGNTSLGTLVCMEAQACSSADAVFGESAKAAGFDHVYRGKASLAQPDFTAECLSAQNAGAEIFCVACPTLAPFQSVLDRLKDDPRFGGDLGEEQGLPLVPDGDAGHRRVPGRHGPLQWKSGPGIGPAQGWTAGKLMEKAGAALTEPRTSAGLLAGLWSINERHPRWDHPPADVRQGSARQAHVVLVRRGDRQPDLDQS